jgi:ribosome-binding factor A
MSQRADRVSELIHKEISSLLVKGLKDPRIGFVTISSVSMTPDLRMAKVYYTVMGKTGACKETAAGLQSSIPFIRKQLGRILRMRFIPELEFLYDESVEYGQRIESILRDIKTEQGDA